MTWKAGGIILPGPYMIGAGVCKTPSATGEWLRIAPVVSGSYTPIPREGNSGRVVWPDTLEEMRGNGFGLNSYGMPNMGIGQAAKELAAINPTHPLVVSVAGFGPDDYYAGACVVHGHENVAALEFNFGCPNTQGEHADILSFNPVVVREILSAIAAAPYGKPLWLKFSPYSNPAELQRMAGLINEFAGRLPLAVVTCNTFPNSYVGEGKISPNGGMAGMSGPALKPIALGQVRQFRQHLVSDVSVIGVGGITTGNDVVDYLEAGADAVQVVSLAHWSGNPRSFQERLLDEVTAGRLLELLETHNH